ncbi:MAG: plastocyanin/azurin family copper-binding protein [Verrucomicrobiota bacterium]
MMIKTSFSLLILGVALVPSLLQAEKNQPAASSASPATPQWIWTEEAGTKQTVYARRQWTQRGKAKLAVLDIACDNAYTLYLNGKQIGVGSSWEKADRYRISKELANGDNVLAIEAKNAGGAAGLVVRLRIENEDGTRQVIVSDEDWLVSPKKLDGWQGPSVAETGWSAAVSKGALGKAPWGDALATPSKKPIQRAPLPTEIVAKAEAKIEGFEVEKLYDVPKETQGSWVSMAVDDQGRLYCSDQDERGLFRITLSGEGVEVEPIPVDVSGAQGLLWHRGALYAGINGGTPASGLVKIMDSNGDGELDQVEILREIEAQGEHGIHAVVPSPDGEQLFLLGGNKSAVPDPESAAVPLNYGEDQLLPSMIDARGHAKDIEAPGGWIARTDLDGEAFELYSAGYRNHYDAAFNAHGELFTYDSDMEWDLGTPWYRPTRIYHVTRGSEFGWRTGSGKFPAWFPDVLPPALEIGPGSPTGVVSGAGAKFPASYQQALYAFDWTYGTIYALHQEPIGSSYKVTKEEFVVGVPLAVTDGVIGADGHLYFAVGGRRTDSALYRVRYTGKESTAPAELVEGPETELRALRREIESYHEEKDGAVDAVWPFLGHEDRFIRFAARLALEHQPIEQWADRVLTETDTEASLSALLALARQGAPEHLPGMSVRLLEIFSSTLTEEQKLSAMRVLGLAMIRLGEPDEAIQSQIAMVLAATYPTASDRLNREVAYTLVALDSPEVVAKTVPLLKQESIAKEGVEVSKDLIARSARYGAVVAESQGASPQKLQMWYAYVLRNITVGWSEGLRRQYLEWFARARNYKGGLSFEGFIENIRQEALAAIPDLAERTALDELSREPAPLVPEGYDDARILEVGCLPGLKFNTELVTAQAGEKVKIQFVNDDPSGLMHNLAVITPGSEQAVVAAAMQIGPDAVARNFIPDIPEVLASTPQVAPGRRYTLYFDVPEEKGDYHFICTYPGHGQVMRAVFRVQ